MVELNQEEFFDAPKGKKGKAVSVWTLTPRAKRYFEATQEYLTKLDVIDAELGVDEGASQHLRDLRREGLVDSMLQMVTAEMRKKDG